MRGEEGEKEGGGGGGGRESGSSLEVGYDYFANPYAQKIVRLCIVPKLKTKKEASHMVHVHARAYAASQ